MIKILEERNSEKKDKNGGFYERERIFSFLGEEIISLIKLCPRLFRKKKCPIYK